MVKQVFSIYLFLFFAPLFLNGQHFERLHALTRERDALQSAYEKLNADVKISKTRKPSVELQAALDKLFAKDAEIQKEITLTETAVRKDLELAFKKEKPKYIKLNDHARELLVDSLYTVVAGLQTRYDSLYSGAASSNSYVQSLQNELRNTADEKGMVKAELDQLKTDKFILARRNTILLYFNAGVAILLLIALIYQLASLRRRKKSSPPEVEISNLKPRPVTGFSAAAGRVAMDAYDSKLEKIEMLGKLRERGLLTDDEFNLQKQQLLQNKNN